MHNAVLLLCNTLWLIILRIHSISYSFPCMDLKFLQYNEVVKALKTGDLRLLRRALREHEDRYVSIVSSFFLQTTIGISFLMLFNPQILTIRCISCFGETGAPGLSKTDKENVKFHLISSNFQLEESIIIFFLQLCASKTKRPQQGTPIEDGGGRKSFELAWNGHGHWRGILQLPSSSESYWLPFITLLLPFSPMRWFPFRL